MKLYSVQYLRGIAAATVLVAHSFEHPLKGTNPFDVIRLGRTGVILFFVISGFIMAFISGEGRFAPLGFLKRRAIRVVPLYWVATFAVAGMAVAAPHLFKNTSFDASHVALSLLFVPHLSPEGNFAPILKLGWTLNYEIFFYLCFAALAFTGAVTRMAVLTIGFAALVVLGWVFSPQAPIPAFYTSYLLLAFCAGGWLGIAALKGRRFGETGGQAAALAALVVAGFAFGFLFERGTRGAELVGAGLALGSAALLQLLLVNEARIGHRRGPALLGDASYSLYLSHMSAIGIVAAVTTKLLHGHAGLWAVAGAGIVGGLVAGLLVFFAVERPLLRLFQRPAARAEPARHPTVPVPVDGVPPGTVA